MSPLLFEIAAKLLQMIVNNEFRLGNLVPPISVPGHEFPIIQYADDTLVVMEASVGQVQILKNCLNSFSLATGLTVNFSKSCLVPINCQDKTTQYLTTLLGCKLGQMPFTYLGLPMGTTN
jgi:hypothetical protein